MSATTSRRSAAPWIALRTRCDAPVSVYVGRFLEDIRSLASGLTNLFLGKDGVPTLRVVVFPLRAIALWPFIGQERPSG
jgi:hypothetical protein